MLYKENMLFLFQVECGRINILVSNRKFAKQGGPKSWDGIATKCLHAKLSAV
jgi:hypothetical protein